MIGGVLVDLFVLARSCCQLNPVFEFQKGERYSKQAFSELLIGNACIRTVSHKRRHERTDVVVLFPASLSFFADQMKARSCHWILLGIRRAVAIG